MYENMSKAGDPAFEDIGDDAFFSNAGLGQ